MTVRANRQLGRFFEFSRQAGAPGAQKLAKKLGSSETILVNLSGRGDKDMGILRENLKLTGTD